jgi:hypothetical protein
MSREPGSIDPKDTKERPEPRPSERPSERPEPTTGQQGGDRTKSETGTKPEPEIPTVP